MINYIINLFFRDRKASDFDQYRELRYKENLVKESVLKFEIPPYSRKINCEWVTRHRVQLEAHQKLYITAQEKFNIFKMAADDIEWTTKENKRLQAIGAGYHRGSYSVIFGGFHCEALKSFLLEWGYKIAPCGNNCDVWFWADENTKKPLIDCGSKVYM